MTWSVEQSRQRYNFSGWSDGYFDVNPRGHLMARLAAGERVVEVDLYELADEIRDAGLKWPVLVRCNGILRDRVDRLYAAFERARERHRFQGSYTAVYPIKVNQQFSVVRQILEHGGERVGLEAGSKSELMAVLGLSRPDGLVICNGYKDREYVRLGLIAHKLGQRIFLVIEKLSELELIIRQASELEVSPLLGVRVRLSSIGAGNWQNTGGAKSKFGLHAAQVLELVERLKSVGMLDRLQLLHFHLGSQLANLGDIRKGVDEAARFYAELHSLGVPVKTVDVGGGLGVDYEGTASRAYCSMNYSLEQYANLIVESLARTSREQGLPQPDIVSESGRALTAHHALLITNVIDTERAPVDTQPGAMDNNVPDSLRYLEQVYRDMEQRSSVETFHEVSQGLEDVQRLFILGHVDLKQQALAEQYYFATLHRLVDKLNPAKRGHRELVDEIHQKLSDKYFCNLSIFQSLPDIWAIDQIFPVVPLHRLEEEPRRRAMLEDLTCDSDGRIDLYVDGEGVESSIPVHDVKPGEPYLLGFFMVGAYQEILGDMHNLFGDTDAVNLEVHADGSHSLCGAEQGDRADELLRYVHFDPDRLRAAYQERIERAGLESSQSRQFLDELEAGLTGYTYHED